MEGQAALTRTEVVKSFIADLARPFAIITTSGSAAWATVTIANRVDGFESAALYIAAVYAGLGGLYGFKSWEKRGEAKSAATVEVVRAQASPPPDKALEPAEKPPATERSLEDPA
jgi:hypothetical protein